MRFVWEFFIVAAVVVVILHFGWRLAGMAVWAWWDDVLASRREDRKKRMQVVSDIQQERVEK